MTIGARAETCAARDVSLMRGIHIGRQIYCHVSGFEEPILVIAASKRVGYLIVENSFFGVEMFGKQFVLDLRDAHRIRIGRGPGGVQRAKLRNILVVSGRTTY